MSLVTKSGLQRFFTGIKNVFAAKNHTHNYAGSASAGGSANSAVKLDTATAGSATQPVYFSGGKPVATTYTLGKSVPSNAVFTDTNTWRGVQNNLTSDATDQSLSAAQGKALKALVDSKAAASHNHRTSSIVNDNSTYFAGGSGPIEAAHIDVLRANRLAFLPAKGVTVEYSTDGGSTWVDYGATDAQKAGLFTMKLGSGGASFYTGKHTATADCTAKDQLRITVTPVDRYCYVNMLYLWVTVAGTTATVDIARSTIGAKTTFTNVRTDVPIGGWSGPSEIRFNGGTFGGGDTQTGNQYAYRFTFKNKVDKKGYVAVYDLRMYGPSAWSIPNSMVMNDHMYNWDNDKNVSFPAAVTATAFNGNASSATKLTNNAGTATRPVYFANGVPVACTYDVNKTVPADAKFTDTNTWRGIQDNLTSDSATDSLSAKQGKTLKALIDSKAASSHTHTAVNGVTPEWSGSIGYNDTSYLAAWNSDGSKIKAISKNSFASASHTHSAFGKATADAAGSAGFVPAPAKGQQGLYLRGDGAWATPTNTTYEVATQSANGLMSLSDKKKLDGIATGANAYTHPTTSGNKHIPAGGSSGQILRWSADGTAVWGADNNTTYSVATASANGLMAAADKAKLDDIGGIVTITKAITLKTDWQNTGITGTDLSTGTYIVQVSGMSSSDGFYNEIYSGVMSWYSSMTNSSGVDEILLHNAGHAENGREIYLRVARSGNKDTPNTLRLQIAANKTSTTAASIVFKFRRMI